MYVGTLVDRTKQIWQIDHINNFVCVYIYIYVCMCLMDRKKKRKKKKETLPRQGSIS